METSISKNSGTMIATEKQSPDKYFCLGDSPYHSPYQSISHDGKPLDSLLEKM